MVVVSYSGKEINAKVVYYGMGLSGKTTNLEMIYEKVPDTSRGKMVSMKTQSDRTLFFDLLPIDLGDVMGFKTRFLLYTVPGQVFYNATRKLVLKGADAVVFVVDSERGKMDENKESLSNLRANLAEYKVNLDDIPWMLQYNKRDLPDVYSIEEMERELNPNGVPHVEAVAARNEGVFETFQVVSKMLIERVTKDLKRQPGGGGRQPVAAATATPAPSVPPPPKASDSGIMTGPAAAQPAASEPSTPAASGPAVGDGGAWSGGGGGGGGPSFGGREIDLPSAPPSTPARTETAREIPAASPGNSPFQNVGKKLGAAISSPAAPGEQVVVPVTLAPGQKLREIVLKIVIQDEEAA